MEEHACVCSRQKTSRIFSWPRPPHYNITHIPIATNEKKQNKEKRNKGKRRKTQTKSVASLRLAGNGFVRPLTVSDRPSKPGRSHHPSMARCKRVLRFVVAETGVTGVAASSELSYTDGLGCGGGRGLEGLMEVRKARTRDHFAVDGEIGESGEKGIIGTLRKRRLFFLSLLASVDSGGSCCFSWSALVAVSVVDSSFRSASPDVGAAGGG